MVAARLGVERAAVRKYVGRAKEASRVPGGPPLSVRGTLRRSFHWGDPSDVAPLTCRQHYAPWNMIIVRDRAWADWRLPRVRSATVRGGARVMDKGKAPKPFLVVSCPRSGSSFFAKLLVDHGLRSVQFPRETPDQYPTGYREYLPISMFLKGLEVLPHGANYRITTAPLLSREDLKDPFIRDTFNLAFDPIRRHTVDFIKSPQLALCADALLWDIPGVVLVGVWRDPRTTFQSLVEKEFPSDMRLTSGLRAVLLWNVYAWHIIRAKQLHPASVMIVNIDDLIRTDSPLTDLLSDLGYSPTFPTRPSESIGRRWRVCVSAPWALYFDAVSAFARAILPLFRRDLANLVDTSELLERLQSLTDYPP